MGVCSLRVKLRIRTDSKQFDMVEDKTSTVPEQTSTPHGSPAESQTQEDIGQGADVCMN